MNTMIVYDNTGKIWFTMAGGELPVECKVINAEVPEGKVADHVDTATGELVLTDRPKSAEEQRLDALETGLAEVKAVQAASLGEELR